MKNSFFSRFTPKEPKFFPLLKQLSEILSASSALLVESLQHDIPEKRADYYKQIKDLEKSIALYQTSLDNAENKLDDVRKSSCDWWGDCWTNSGY